MERKVSTLSLFDTRCSVASVREEFFHMTGTWCTEPEALAAVYSVPDGAPCSFAAINVGCKLTDAAAKHFETMRGSFNSAIRRMGN